MQSDMVDTMMFEDWSLKNYRMTGIQQVKAMNLVNYSLTLRT